MPERSESLSISELKHQPISVIKTELPALAKALGMDTAELVRSIAGIGGAASGDCRCCGNDSW